MPTVSARELDTILAALTFWSNNGSRLRLNETRRFCYRHGTPLEQVEVRLLLEKLNTMALVKERNGIMEPNALSFGNKPEPP
jgi:hypothetical protein